MRKSDVSRAGTPPRDPRRRQAFCLGLAAESRAVQYFVAKGYHVLSQRFRSPAGEIDIVARREGTLVFVEVKARKRLAAAAEALTPRQQRRIIAAAEAWLAHHPEDLARNIRFDVLLVAPRRLRHIPAAFDASF